VVIKIVSDSVDGEVFVFDTVIVSNKSVHFAVELLGFGVGMSVLKVI